MNHEAKYSGGIFGRRRTPSVASSSSRLNIQSSRSGSLSCPTSPRHQPKQLPPTPSTTNLNNFSVPTSSNISNALANSRLHRSSSQSNYNNNSSYKQRSSGYCAYTGINSKIFKKLLIIHNLRRFAICTNFSSQLTRRLIKHWTTHDWFGNLFR